MKKKDSVGDMLGEEIEALRRGMYVDQFIADFTAHRGITALACLAARDAIA